MSPSDKLWVYLKKAAVLDHDLSSLLLAKSTGQTSFFPQFHLYKYPCWHEIHLLKSNPQKRSLLSLPIPLTAYEYLIPSLRITPSCKGLHTVKELFSRNIGDNVFPYIQIWHFHHQYPSKAAFLNRSTAWCCQGCPGILLDQTELPSLVRLWITLREVKAVEEEVSSWVLCSLPPPTV